MIRPQFVLFPALLLLVACEKGPPEIASKDPQGAGAPANGGAGVSKTTPASPATSPVDLKTATEGLPGQGALFADLDTESGKISCKLFDDKAPIAVANFVALARGIQSFKDPIAGGWVKRPAYDGTTFHRIIKGFMIQGGDPAGSGSGDPGYIFPDEKWDGAHHDRAGLLCMANRGPNTNGMQFFITDDAAPHLDSSYTIFGECSPLEVVHKIANTPVAGEKPLSKPHILKVTVRRS
jgi:peptidyl-prolyl cis-trans isomerase A (cyclophilin A)